MKKVVINPPVVEPTVTLSEANPRKYYGILSLYEGKGFIKQEKFESGPYQGICSNGLTKGNAWGAFQDTSLPGLFGKIFDRGYSIFEFDSPQELFKWLSE